MMLHLLFMAGCIALTGRAHGMHERKRGKKEPAKKHIDATSRPFLYWLDKHPNPKWRKPDLGQVVMPKMPGGDYTHVGKSFQRGIAPCFRRIGDLIDS